MQCRGGPKMGMIKEKAVNVAFAEINILYNLQWSITHYVHVKVPAGRRNFL